MEVDFFYDGDDIFKVRAYCDQLGDWKWQTSSSLAELDYAVHTESFPVTAH